MGGSVIIFVFHRLGNRACAGVLFRLRQIMKCLRLCPCDRIRYALVFVALLGSGCSGTNWMVPFKAYRIDIQQGNAVTPEMVSKLKPGMTRAQVRFVLGTPLLVDTFRENRWDYVYYFEKPNEPRVYRHLAVFFKSDRLERLEGDLVPLSDEKDGLLGPDKTQAGPKSEPVKPEAGSTAAGVSGSGSQKSGAPENTPSASKESKPAAEAPAKEGGYSAPIKDSLGF